MSHHVISCKVNNVISKYNGLGLTKGKCAAIGMNNDWPIHFDDGNPLTKEFEPT